MKEHRDLLKDKKRIVIKLGTTTITHAETGKINLSKLEKLVRIVTDLNNSGKEVVVVSSGAIAVGRIALGLAEKPKRKALKQACAAIGQAKLMMVYQKLFSEYNQTPAQVLITKYTIINDISRENAHNTFHELLNLGVIPIVNENDTVSTDEIELPLNDSHTSIAFGDNDSLSAMVAALIDADLLILLSDIDGLYTNDPNKDENAKFIEYVPNLDSHIADMAKGSSNDFGTGGMITKITAARIATDSGADMVIANGEDISNINKILSGKNIGTLFAANRKENFELIDYIV
ncbi:MAG: glutamate 5-kinase [Lachnospiraceae bacterium]|nr:glutamate 5-kinase [Lachnospiraceae bacterium]